ncbi:hypothetical protein EC915_101330 [Pseudomonas sp. LP_7_YM]|nr:hypothetical protein EC915_101330 [Pseudomonas sp. LP_7_YM]
MKTVGDGGSITDRFAVYLSLVFEKFASMRSGMTV